MKLTNPPCVGRVTVTVCVRVYIYLCQSLVEVIVVDVMVFMLQYALRDVDWSQHGLDRIFNQ